VINCDILNKIILHVCSICLLYDEAALIIAAHDEVQGHILATSYVQFCIVYKQINSDHNKFSKAISGRILKKNYEQSKEICNADVDSH